MIIQDFIADIVSQMTVEGSTPSVAPTFVHGDKGWQNLLVDEITNDVILLDEPVISNDSYKQSGLLEETYNTSMLFLTKGNLDNKPEDDKPLIARMRRLRKKYIDKLSASALLKDKNFNIRTIDVVNVFNVALTGCWVTMTITPIETQSRCS